MKVLIVGQGGREHALAWHAAQHASHVFVAPGNDGMQATNITLTGLAASDTEALLALARNESIDLTLIGPEAPLVAGLVDRFKEAGLPCFGPSQAASQLEGSKTFMKQLLLQHNIPTAQATSHHSLPEAQIALGQRAPGPVVVKADGLAAGKGVVVAHTTEEAQEALRFCFEELQADTVLLEDFLEGEEISFMVLTDGTHVLPLPSAQDHKALHEGDTGPNTGGMGAYSPAPAFTEALETEVLATIIHPTLKAMREAGTPFVGFLYAGLMIDPQGKPWVLEYNVRLGDPETQVLMMRLQSSLPEACCAALNGTLGQHCLQLSPQASLGVVVAAPGYPGSPKRGLKIKGLKTQKSDNNASSMVFHAGTALNQDGFFETQGGRVLCVAALGDNLAQAKQMAEQQLQSLSFEGMQWRRDIGHRALKRTEREPGLPEH